MKKIFSLCALCVLFAFKGFAQLDAQTDMNGYFLWPPWLWSSQVTPYTNTTLSGGVATGGAAWNIPPTSHFTFVDANGMVISFGTGIFSVEEADGNGFYYSNGVMSVIGNTSFNPNFLISIISAFNTNLSVAPPAYSLNLQSALNNLSNQMFLMFSTTDSVYQASFRQTNTVVFNALLATNVATSNILAAIINTNSINLTNWIAINSGWLTNYDTNLAGITFAAGSNYTASVSNSLTTSIMGASNAVQTYALNLFTSTNLLSAHFRFGSFPATNSISEMYINFSPPYNDPSFLVFLSSQTASGLGQPITYWGYATTYQQFVCLANTNVPGGTLNYMTYHP